MPVLKYLADTCVISDAFSGKPTILDWMMKHRGEVGICTLTLAEIRRGIEILPNSKRRNELDRKYSFTLEDYNGAIFCFDESSAMEWGRLMAESVSFGKNLPLSDSLIAAVARSSGLKVATHNVKHFLGCDVVDPTTGLEQAAWDTH